MRFRSCGASIRETEGGETECVAPCKSVPIPCRVRNAAGLAVCGPFGPASDSGLKGQGTHPQNFVEAPGRISRTHLAGGRSFENGRRVSKGVGALRGLDGTRWGPFWLISRADEDKR